jgi:hypothetical protein
MSKLNNEGDLNPTLMGMLDVTFNKYNCKQ